MELSVSQEAYAYVYLYLYISILHFFFVFYPFFISLTNYVCTYPLSTLSIPRFIKTHSKADSCFEFWHLGLNPIYGEQFRAK